MKRRATIYLGPEFEVLLKLEVQRQKRPMAELIRSLGAMPEAPAGPA